MVVPSEEFCGHHGLPNWAICVKSRHHERSSLCSADSEFGQHGGRLANPVTLCGGHGVFFVAASGQIRIAANNSPDLFGIWIPNELPASPPGGSAKPV
jgi:hypothetical protein